MTWSQSRSKVEELMASADVQINGDRPWDIQVHNEDFYHRILAQGSLGLGESYMDVWWDCERLDQFVYKVLMADLDKKVMPSRKMMLSILKTKLFNPQGKSRAFNIGEKHYDTGNDLFKNMLDKRMVYSCGYWKDVSTLDEAQEAKLELVCRKLGLRPGQTVLDIGCGWGSFAKYAAEKYRVGVVGITVSKEQVTLGKELCKGLPVEIRLQDYRELKGTFDHIVSIGMFEHVGPKNYRTYMEVVHRCLTDDGLFLLHTIGNNLSNTPPDPWSNKYIFPDGVLPSIKLIGGAIEDLFVMEDWHNFGVDYEKTLMAWFENFHNKWDDIEGRYGERFYRMWKYFLLTSAGSARSRRIQLWQIVLSKKGVPVGYLSIR